MQVQAHCLELEYVAFIGLNLHNVYRVLKFSALFSVIFFPSSLLQNFLIYDPTGIHTKNIKVAILLLNFPILKD